jgi:hypothetical protein
MMSLGTPRNRSIAYVRLAFTTGLCFVWFVGSTRVADAQVTAAAASYSARSDRAVMAKPSLPSLGPAGSTFSDPTFGSRMLRVTDGNTRPSNAGQSYTTPSAAHQTAWNADSTRFYVRSVDGYFVPYSFNASSMTASRMNATSGGTGGLLVNSQAEPQFSFVSPNILYVSRQDSNNMPVVAEYDFNTGTYIDLVNLGTVAPISGGTYTGGLGSSAGSTERVMAFFGGSSQDSHFLVAVFAANNPHSVTVLNSTASTVSVNNQTVASGLGLGFHLHHAFMDKSGQYVILESTAADRPGSAPLYVWDTSSNRVTPLPQSALPGGHYATGYGMLVNQDCCTSTSWDAAQWQLRSLSNPTATQDLINPVVTPQEVNASDHSSWNNAQPGTLVPFISGFFRSSSDTSNWRPWDGEIVAVQTGGGTTVWRFAHHRSNVSQFWDMPRPNVSQDGRWAIFTSNWEGAVGSGRDDVFMVSLGGLSGGGSPAPTPTPTPAPTPAPSPTPTPAPAPSPTPTPAPSPTPAPAPPPSNPPTTSTGASIQWTLLANAVASGNSIQKTGGCDGCPDAGGMSTQQLTADGAVQFTASETDSLRFLGLTSGSATVDPSAFAFAVRLQRGVAEVREYGAYKTETSFATGDQFRIVVTGGAVSYQKNGATFYSSGASAAFPLSVNASLFSMNATLTGITIATTSQGTIGATPAPTAPTPTAPAAAPAGTATWMMPAQMAPGASVLSHNGQYWLVYQTDGNLVLYDTARNPLWSSGTAGTSPGRVVMQDDGNLVIYDASGAPVWASNTPGNAAARAVVQDDGNVVVYDSGWQPLWNRLAQ